MAAATKTSYLILRAANEGDDLDAVVSYQPFAAGVAASSAVAAIRATAKEPGKYVAVPSRSWTEIPVTVETQTVIKLGTGT